MKYAVALGIALILNAAANLLMKVGASSAQAAGGLVKGGLVSSVKTVLTSTPLVIGLICFALNAAFYMYALQSKALKISIAYPIMVGGGYALIATVACLHPALAETMTRTQKAGVALVLVGIVLIASHASG